MRTLLLLLPLLAGCDSAEFEIARQKGEIGERLRLNVIPAHGELVVLQWNEMPGGKFCLSARRIQPNSNYTKTMLEPDVRRIGCQEDFSL